MSAIAQIRLQLDRIAYGRQTQQAAFGTGDDFWTKVDAAADETYENRVKGSDITAIDAELALGGRWYTPALTRWFTLHEDYFRTDLGYAAVGTAPAMAAYLAAVGGFRIPYLAALSLTDAQGSMIMPAARVSPKGILPASEATPLTSGMHRFGTLTGPTTWASVDGALPSTVGPVGILAVNLSATQTVAGTFRCTNYVAATYKDIALSLSTAAQYTQTILGSVAVASGVTAGDLLVQVGATTTFTAGEYVLLYESDAVQELMLVATLGTGPTRLTTTTPILNNYTTGGVVIPLFRSAAYQTGGTGTNDVAIYARPDRAIAL